MSDRCLEIVISGGQDGVDRAALIAALSVGLKTGGYMPRGWRTLSGPRPEYRNEFGMIEHPSPNFRDRTRANVESSDATLRIASYFSSPGELCTEQAIRDFSKPYFDVPVPYDAPAIESLYEAARWILQSGVRVLNVAGNSEQTAPGIFTWSMHFLACLFGLVGKDLP